MHSDLPKVLHRIDGRPMLSFVVDAVRAAGIPRIIAIVGYGADQVVASLDGDVLYVHQFEQLGTGHAVACAAPLCPRVGSLLIVCGDTPLLLGKSLFDLVRRREESGAAAVMLTMELDDPRGYGRIVRGPDGRIVGVVEEKDATPEQKAIREVNSGVYCFDSALIFGALSGVGCDNAQKEYYLPDALKALLRSGALVETVLCSEPAELVGVNTPEQLRQVAEVIARRKEGR